MEHRRHRAVRRQIQHDAQKTQAHQGLGVEKAQEPKTCARNAGHDSPYGLWDRPHRPGARAKGSREHRQQCRHVGPAPPREPADAPRRQHYGNAHSHIAHIEAAMERRLCARAYVQERQPRPRTGKAPKGKGRGPSQPFSPICRHGGCLPLRTHKRAAPHNARRPEQHREMRVLYCVHVGGESPDAVYRLATYLPAT